MGECKYSIPKQLVIKRETSNNSTKYISKNLVEIKKEMQNINDQNRKELKIHKKVSNRS